MYEVLLMAHSTWRWVALAAIGLRLAWAGASWLRGKAWTPVDRRFSAAAVGTVDLQVLLGLVLYVFLSPVVHTAMADPGAAMKDAPLRFALVEHPTMMVLGVVLLHVGSVLARRQRTDSAKHRTEFIGQLLGLGALLAGLPR